MGKGVVVAKDSPYVIGNRIGIFAMLLAMKERSEHGFSMQEVDALTGPAEDAVDVAVGLQGLDDVETIQLALGAPGFDLESDLVLLRRHENLLRDRFRVSMDGGV